MIDDLPEVIQIKVVTSTGLSIPVSILPTWRAQAVLSMELSQANLDLLLEDPPAKEFKPTMSHENVMWVGTRMMVRCNYYDKATEKVKTKSIKVVFPDGADAGGKQQRVDEAAESCQEFYDSNHYTPPPNEKRE